MVKPFQIYELCQWNSFMLVQWVELHGIYQSRVTLGDSDYGENCLRILDVLLIPCVTILVHVSCYDRKLQIG